MRKSLFLLGAGLLIWVGAAAADDKTVQPKPGAAATSSQGPNAPRNTTVAPRKKAAAEEPDEAAGRPASIRVDTNLVLINVTVTDPLNRFVTGLESEHFKLFEDKVEQRIATFASEDAPLSVGLVFDASGSMGAKLQKARLAAAQFFKTANPEDEFFLVQFNDKPEMTHPFTDRKSVV